MVVYNPKHWWQLIFMFHKSDAFRQLLPSMLFLAVYTAGVVYLEIEIWAGKIKSTPAIHSLVGFILSMLLVFRTNSAYDRWWEARKIWGSLVNNSRSIAIKLNALLPKENTEERQRLAAMISKLAFILKEHLRGSASPDEAHLPEPYGKNWMKNRVHLPNSVCLALTEEIHGLKTKNLINDSHLIYLSDEIKTFSDVIGACERIKNTPIPFSYSLFIKKVIFLYVITMPFAFANDLKYWAIPIISLIFYAFVGLEIIAEEIEEPFGKDANDLPTDALAEKINKDVEEILLKI